MSTLPHQIPKKIWCAQIAVLFCLLALPSFIPAQQAVCGFQWMLDKQASSDTSVHQRSRRYAVTKKCVYRLPRPSTKLMRQYGHVYEIHGLCG